jgi:hypothetical protein
MRHGSIQGSNDGQARGKLDELLRRTFPTDGCPPGGRRERTRDKRRVAITRAPVDGLAELAATNDMAYLLSKGARECKYAS